MKKNKKAVEKLEHELSHFLIDEMCKRDPSKKLSSEMYKYRGLSINLYQDEATSEKIITVRIGPLEAEFKVESGDKFSGALAPGEEQAIRIWISQSDNNALIRSAFKKEDEKRELKIVPFDLEEMFD